MDKITETPPKRLGIGDVEDISEFDDASADELFTDYDTIATVPLPKQKRAQPSRLPSPDTYVTQPTQLIGERDRIPESPRRETVQVAASSPIRQPPTPTPAAAAPTLLTGGSLAVSMAPPGTAFRCPPGVKSVTQTITLDDSDEDAMPYQGGSSDDGGRHDRNDIKPTVLKPKKGESSSFNKHRALFNKTIKESMYRDPNTNENTKASGQPSTSPPGVKRAASEIGGGYGGPNHRPTKIARQNRPSKAQPVSDLTMDDMPDFLTRKKIDFMRGVLPGYPIRKLKDALDLKHANVDDAVEMLMSQKPASQEVDLTKSDDEVEILQSLTASKKPAAKQQLKAPTRTIAQKYGFALLSSQARPQEKAEPVLPQNPPKPRKRLVKGRRFQSSRVESPAENLKSSSEADTPSRLDDSDSGVASDAEEKKDFGGNLLEFFNTCSAADLADMASVTDQVTQIVLSKRPFKSLNQVRKISEEEQAPIVKKGRSRRPKRPIGERIVDVCERMWAGYEAVDKLVNQCKELGAPVAEEMKQWGVDVNGASKDGELGVVSVNPVKNDESGDGSLRDSGIGTPTSGSSSNDEDGEVNVRNVSSHRRKHKSGFFPQPSIMSREVTLKDYQVFGMNWLAVLFKNNLSCILADDMGLGKTCQVIAFLAHLHETQVKGPHLIIVPGSTLENWLREFKTFCPALSVMPYYGSMKEREEIQDEIIERDPDVVVTTYNVSKPKEDRKFLRKLNPTVCVFDEGHQLKNTKSKAYEELMKIRPKFRLLLTGTPLQNNLIELTSLLGFILPDVFNEHKEDLDSIFGHRAKTTDESHHALLSAQRIERARSMMTPFILRRKKYQVLMHLPPKTRRVEYCDMTPVQESVYREEEARYRQIVQDRKNGVKAGKEMTNHLMILRKAAIHPLLFRRSYDMPKLKEMSEAFVSQPGFSDRDAEVCCEDMTVMTDFELHRFCCQYPPALSPYALESEPWLDSGKVAKLCSLLRVFKTNGDRALIFSQFVIVMDILEEVLQSIDVKFFRLDGSTKIEERQDLLDEFYQDESVTAFMLSTKAGGAGINLACANKVIIFDSSFNPQDDIQAENRAHRVGQTKDVEVIRLVTKGTIEEQIHALGESKIALDERVAGDVESEESKKSEEKATVEGMQKVQEMLERAA